MADMNLTREAFGAVKDRQQAFTLVLYAVRGQLRSLSQKFVLWLDAAASPSRKDEAALRRQGVLAVARQIRSDLDVLIAELEAEDGIAAREAA
jgi:hypothetical protein